MAREPVAHVPFEVVEAVIVAVPAVAEKVAVLPENVTTDVSLEVQLVELVTSTLFNVAVKVAVVPAEYVGPLGTELIVSVCALPPVTLPVIDPLTPPTLAVIVTPEAAPIPVTRPVALTVAHALELDHEALLVTSFVPLLNVAVAVSC
jgi:hypothetical protein